MTESKVGDAVSFGLVQSLSEQLETVVREQMGGIEVAVSTLPSDQQAEHFFEMRQRLALADKPK